MKTIEHLTQKHIAYDQQQIRQWQRKINKLKDIIESIHSGAQRGDLEILICEVKEKREVSALKLFFQRAQIQFTALISAHIGLYLQLQGTWHLPFTSMGATHVAHAQTHLNKK